MYQKQKLLDLGEKISSSVLVAGGVLAGGATLNPIVLGVISGLGLVMKTIQEAKNRGKKIEKAKFAFTNYEKALSNLKFALRGGEFDQRKFLVEMETLDGIVIDFGLNHEKFEKKFREKWGKGESGEESVPNLAQHERGKSGFSHGWVYVRKSNLFTGNLAETSESL